jgi:hypothetical protein
VYAATQEDAILFKLELCPAPLAIDGLAIHRWVPTSDDSDSPLKLLILLLIKSHSP